MDFFDDDQNVIAMRETARTVGLTSLIVRVHNSQDDREREELLRQAIRLLGATDEEVARGRTGDGQ